MLFSQIVIQPSAKIVPYLYCITVVSTSDFNAVLVKKCKQTLRAPKRSLSRRKLSVKRYAVPKVFYDAIQGEDYHRTPLSFFSVPSRVWRETRRDREATEATVWVERNRDHSGRYMSGPCTYAGKYPAEDSSKIHAQSKNRLTIRQLEFCSTLR